MKMYEQQEKQPFQHVQPDLLSNGVPFIMWKMMHLIHGHNEPIPQYKHDL